MERLFARPCVRDAESSRRPHRTSRHAARLEVVTRQPQPRDADRPRPDLGRLVHVHQGRRPGAHAGDADHRPARARGAHARRCSCRSSSAPARPCASCARTGCWLVVVALVNTAIPFWLLSWGETRIDSGLASIIQAAVPIFNALIAFVALPRGARDRLAPARRRGRLRRRRAARRRAAAGQDPRRARRRRDGVLLRRRRAARAGGTCARRGRSWSRSPRPRSRRSSWLPVGVAQAPSQLPSWKTIGSVRRARRARDGARVSPLLRADHRRRRGATRRSSPT